jgi:hypothetical protein
MVLFDPRRCLWRAVFVDDQFVVSDDGDNAFSHCRDRNVLWLSVLEKCYIKLFGGVDNVIGGFPYHHLSAFTGSSVIEMMDTQTASPLLIWQRLTTCIQSGFLCAAWSPLPVSGPPVVNGISRGGVYLIKYAKLLDGNSLLQLANMLSPAQWDGSRYARTHDTRTTRHARTTHARHDTRARHTHDTTRHNTHGTARHARILQGLGPG